MASKTKVDFDFMPGWKKEQALFDKELIRGIDSQGRRGSPKPWPRLEPMSETIYLEWLKRITDEDGEFFPQRNANGTPLKNSNPTYKVTVIVRIMTKDKKEFLYTKGELKGYNAAGDPDIMHIQKPEVWTRTLFSHKKVYNESTMSFSIDCQGPSHNETVYDLPFNEKNLKALYNNRKSDELNFVLKDEQTGQARGINDQTHITSKTLELFQKPFDYLWNADFLSQQMKAELRAEAQMRGLIPNVQPPSASGPVAVADADTHNQLLPGPKPEPHAHKDNLGIG